MVEESKNRLPHLLVRNTATTTPYTKPRRKIESGGLKIPQRDRKAHAERLISQIAQGQEREADIIREQKAFGLDAGNGIYLSFESEPGFGLKFESLEFQRSGIELCAIKQMDDQTIATVFIPEGKLDHFQQRINQQARDEEYNRRPIQDSGQWTLGERLRGLGSIHSDTWHGTAAELADRGHVAIYPVLGWWKERPNLQRWGKRARYALVITIGTPGVETDIYTPVANQIATVVEV